MRKLARLLLAAALVLGQTAPTLPQSPPPVPALPDSERTTSYAIVAQTGPFDVGFAVYGDSTDYGNWLEVWLDSTKLTAVTDWTLALVSGTLATAARPLTNAQVTLTTARTGTLRIVSAQRPRRLSQFTENRGVTARDLNQVITSLTAQEREQWDLRGRTILAPAGETMNALPSAATRAGALLVFDGSGNPTVGAAGVGTGNVIGPSSATSGHIAIFVGTSGTLLADGGAIGSTTLTGDVTGGPAVGTIATTLANSGVSANTYGSGTLVPVIAVDAKGRITGATSSAITPNGIGAVPSSRLVSAGTGLSGGGDLTADRTISLGSIAALSFLANISGGAQVPSAATLTQVLDALAGSTQGNILHRTGAAWTVLAPGTSGQLLTSGGGGANVSWTTASGTGTVTSISAGSGISVSPSPITASGTVSINAVLTAHGLLIAEASSAIANTGAGSKGQCIASNGGAGSDPSWKTGCRVLLASYTATASASIADTSAFTSDYSSIELEFINVIPATNNAICRLRVNSVGVQTTTYVTQWYVAGSGAAPTTYIACTSTNSVISNSSTGPGTNGIIRIYNPSDTTRRKMVNGVLSYNRSDGTVEPITTSGYWNGGNGAITGFEVSMDSGNLAGTINVYGRK